MNCTKWLATLTSLIVVFAGLITMAPAARADDIRNYQVAFTNGMGVRLRVAPSVTAPGFPALFGELAIPEGSWYPAECETYGDWVTNVYGESTNIYLRAQVAAFGVGGPVFVSSAGQVPGGGVTADPSFGAVRRVVGRVRGW